MILESGIVDLENLDLMRLMKLVEREMMELLLPLPRKWKSDRVRLLPLSRCCKFADPFSDLAIKQTKSFFGGWFKREPAAAQPVGPGPVRANLGEQTSFVFDPELKRWVNKKVIIPLVLSRIALTTSL